MTVVVQEPIKFKWISLNVCPNFSLIFKWRQLLQLCLYFEDYLNYVTNPPSYRGGLGPFEIHHLTLCNIVIPFLWYFHAFIWELWSSFWILTLIKELQGLFSHYSSLLLLTWIELMKILTSEILFTCQDTLFSISGCPNMYTTSQKREKGKSLFKSSSFQNFVCSQFNIIVIQVLLWFLRLKYILWTDG